MQTASRGEESIFSEALELACEQRAAFLDEACGANAELRARVENLLNSHEGAGSFLHKLPPATTDSPPIERPGTILGPYKLLQEIGEGGMGVVYMAEQETPVRRRVALKIIKPGMDSRQVIARFEAERQALAMMDHQNIARVLDAGTTGSGRPYFVMELVHGVPVTKFCEDNRLTLRERLELFVPICHAIQYAHHKGVIHRDIKPSNLLVTMYDDKPVPKVIDFGVAKAVEQRLTEKTLFTQFGTLVGTFEYMSPEQAEMNALGVDTRSDVYSLGVLIYELLTGTTPLERPRVREAALNELVRLIKEEEPPRPSMRLSTANTLPKFAAACRMEPARLPQLLRGELDWIVMKCLEKDRTRRYETANGLARDVQHYLADEPVEACPPSLSYRFSKFARKHRRLFTTAASLAGVLIVGAIVSAWLAAWALNAQRKAELALAGERAARAESEQARQDAEAVSRRLITSTQVLNDGIDHFNQRQWASAHERFSKAAEIEPNLRGAYLHRSCLFTTLGLWQRAAQDYDQCFRLVNRATAQMRFQHALLKYATGDEQGYRRACEGMIEQYGRSGNNSNRYHLVRARILAPQPEGDLAELARRAEQVAGNWRVPWTMQLAGMTHLRAGNFEQSVARFRNLLDAEDDAPLQQSLVHAPLAMALHQLGKHEEAKAALQMSDQVFENWTKEIAEGTVATMPIHWWDWLEGLQYHREAKAMLTGSKPEEDPRLLAVRARAEEILQGDAYTLMQAARGQIQRQAWDEAAASYDQALDSLPRLMRPSTQQFQFHVEMVEHPEVFRRLIELRPDAFVLWWARGQVFANGRRWAEAAADLGQAHRLIRVDPIWPTSGLQVPDVSITHYLALLRQLAGDEAGYRDLCDEIIAESKDSTDPWSANALARACVFAPSATATHPAALQMARRAVLDDPRNAWYLFGLGLAHYRAGEHAEAIKQLEESLHVSPVWLGRGQNYVVLAMACQQLDRQSEARQWLAKSKASLEEMEQTIGNSRFGYAGSSYFCDWLSLLILIPEAEQLLAGAASD